MDKILYICMSWISHYVAFLPFHPFSALAKFIHPQHRVFLQTQTLREDMWGNWKFQFRRTWLHFDWKRNRSKSSKSSLHVDTIILYSSGISTRWDENANCCSASWPRSLNTVARFKWKWKQPWSWFYFSLTHCLMYINVYICIHYT